MRLFGRKATPEAPPGAAEAEAEAELRRAVEALGMPVTPEDGSASALVPPPAAADLSVGEETVEDVPAPGEAGLPEDEARDDERGAGRDDQRLPEEDAPDGDPGVRLDDLLPEEAPGAEPPRRRVRKTPPAAAQPARRSAAAASARRPATTRTPGSTRQGRATP